MKLDKTISIKIVKKIKNIKSEDINIKKCMFYLIVN